MKNSLTVKFIAVLLCALMLLSVASCVAGFFVLGSTGILSGKSPKEIRAADLERLARWAGTHTASAWASREFGSMPLEITGIQMEQHTASLKEGSFFCVITDAEGEELYSNYNDEPYGYSLKIELEEIPYEEFLGHLKEGEPEGEDWGVYEAISYQDERFAAYYAREKTLVEPVEVTVYLMEDAQTASGLWDLMDVFGMRKTQIIILTAVSLLLFSIAAVYLCVSAGHRPGTEEVRPSGLNALPLDLYAVGLGMVLLLCGMVLMETADWIVEQSWQTVLLCFGAMGFVVCLLVVAFFFAFAAQVKLPKAHWFWNTLCGRCLKLAWWLTCKCFRLIPKLWELLVRLMKGMWRLFVRALRAFWKVTVVLLTLAWQKWLQLWNWFRRNARRFLRWLDGFFSRLPLTWQWLAAGGVVMAWLLLSMADRNENMFMLGCVAGVLILSYGANAFGVLLDSVKKMRTGDLQTKIDDRMMVGAFREFAEELNGLADAATVTTQKQLRSERMKTELITNVSHDIKTPLTSIINYVDLLEKPHTSEEEKVYLEVLHRQSQRMKKLIEDLMEMSKASTGNIPVEITQIDAVEVVNQALGEFADKLTAAGLTPVFRHEDAVYVRADGRLLWRTMNNLLSNAVKYSLPGTRLYVDVTAVENQVLISFKNVSGVQLNISADELMERFVRGDSSRNTEGSGLGLNIAKSLMELQKGQLQLVVDGDLFKATMIFPKAD